MLCVSPHSSQYKHISDLIRNSANHIMSHGGVVRGVKFGGTKTLPQRFKRHGNYHTIGDYWSLHFDSAPRTLHSLNSIMRRDPCVIRWSVLKLAQKAEHMQIS